MLPKLYYQIKGNQSIKISLEELFDFITTEPTNTDQYWFNTEETLIILAANAAGGIYAAIEKGDNIEKFPIVYISSEGQAGKIAKSFSELVQLIIQYPYWHDMLRFSDGGDLEKMFEAILYLENERIEVHSDYKEVQHQIIDKLGIVNRSDILENMLKVVFEKPYFRVFSADDNTMSDHLIDI